MNSRPASEARYVLVTGCSSGFGEVIVRTLAAHGHHVYASMRDVAGRNAGVAQELQRSAENGPGEIVIVEMDVADDESVDAAITSILDSGHRIDAVVNNAGVAAAGPIEAFTTAQMQSLYSVNVFGPMRVDRAVLPQMRARGNGLLLHVSSTLGRILPRSGGLYPASKWALEGLVESLYYQVMPFGIDAVILEPGSFPTPAVSKSMQAANQAVGDEYAKVAASGPRATPGPDYKLPDLQEIGDAVLRLVEMPPGRRPLRTVVGPIFTFGVEEYNQQYEAARERLAEYLKRPDQAITWGRPAKRLPAD